MNYCSIEDAWGESNEFQEKKQNQSNIETFKNIDQCEIFITHIKKCNKCYNKMKYQFEPKLIKNIQQIIDENKDNVVLILIAIFILLFFNLII